MTLVCVQILIIIESKTVAKYGYHGEIWPFALSVLLTSSISINFQGVKSLFQWHKSHSNSLCLFRHLRTFHVLGLKGPQRGI